MIEKKITVRAGEKAAFRNLTAQCVGTGRLDLALHQEYQDQLRAVQELCHFQHIRGHGLLSDQMGIYQEHTDKNGQRIVEYCFTYLDRVMDSYLKNGLTPFLELGFMPEKLAAGEQTLFYWKAHTTPPKRMEDWQALIKATLEHLKRRYGEERAQAWPCEIWNEPNLPGFWENADKQKYSALYKATVQAVKEVLPGMKVGGPAICGGTGSQQWIADFLSFCRDEKVPVDFVTRHAYMGQTPEHKGRYLYHAMNRPEDLIADPRLLARCEHLLLESLLEQKLPFTAAVQTIDYGFNLPAGSALSIYKALIRSGTVIADMNQKIQPGITPLAKGSAFL